MSSSPTRIRASTKREYAGLVAAFPPRPIRSNADHAAALRVIERMMKVAAPSRAKCEYVDVLATMVARYEEQNYPLAPVSLSTLLAHLIEAQGVSCAEVARGARVSPSLISDVLAERRTLSVENIRRLALYFHVSPSLFVEARR